jgi:hypothetical protein
MIPNSILLEIYVASVYSQISANFTSLKSGQVTQASSRLTIGTPSAQNSQE